MPGEYLMWKLIFDTGWTLDYIESLTMQDFHDYLNVKDAMNKAKIY
jgi:hypothetical protein